MKNKKRIITIVFAVILILGIGILLYPTVSDWVNKKHSSKVIDSYVQAVEKNDDERIKELLALAKAYNDKLSKNPDAFYQPELVEGYEELLDVSGNGIMGILKVEKIKLEVPIYHGTSKENLQVGAGHLQGSSLPIGGKSTHAVISGHRGLPSAKLFTDLDKLIIGDTFTVTVLGRTLKYKIDQIKVVLPTETSDLLIVKDMDYCTLLTCTPYGVNSHRLLVRGCRVEE